ncbi:MAG: MBL fold metallo-hydrolase [Pirellulaceae bacterium]|nr:MBL fold metallo-hydrolase [Pirellulaceae bacterium]
MHLRREQQTYAKQHDPQTTRKHIKTADYMLLSHSHWDHAGDVSEIAAYADAVIVGSANLPNH